jgi:predicted RNA-binding protein with PIN domain
MPWLIDGSNVLGSDRLSDEARRALLKRLAGFARAKKTRVTCVFDGEPSTNFATQLGAVSVVFSRTRTADDVIVERTTAGKGWRVVTSDFGLAARVRRRDVEIVSPRELIAMLEEMNVTTEQSEEDWEKYFSDSKNRVKF